VSEPAPRTTEPDHDLVDWRRTARRMRASGVVLLGLTVVAWLASGALFTWLGVALGVLFVVEVVVVGGSALRGMLRAGQRGERLAGPDVGLLPTRRRRQRDAATGDEA